MASISLFSPLAHAAVDRYPRRVLRIDGDQLRIFNRQHRPRHHQLHQLDLHRRQVRKIQHARVRRVPEIAPDQVGLHMGVANVRDIFLKLEIELRHRRDDRPALENARQKMRIPRPRLFWRRRPLQGVVRLHYGSTSTGVPTLTIFRTFSAFQLARRKQPCDCVREMFPARACRGCRSRAGSGRPTSCRPDCAGRAAASSCA
jgi:hypothetical protein